MYSTKTPVFLIGAGSLYPQREGVLLRGEDVLIVEHHHLVNEVLESMIGHLTCLIFVLAKPCKQLLAGLRVDIVRGSGGVPQPMCMQMFAS